jgi:YidC/Oxa1 family membrane protein insertase
MEKNTLLAVVLSVIVITIGFMVQNYLNPPVPPPSSARTEQTQTTPEAVPGTGETPQITTPLVAPVQQAAPLAGTIIPVVGEVEPAETTVTLETDLFLANFSSRGGVVKSLKLKGHKDKEDYVDMVLPAEKDPGAFSLSFGGYSAPPVEEPFFVRKVDPYTLEFYREFEVAGYPDSAFRLTKRYIFRPGEYLVQVDIILEDSNLNSVLPLNFNNTAYTLRYGPQLGPQFTKLDGRADYRRYYMYIDKKRKEVKLPEGKEKKFWINQAGLLLWVNTLR